MLGKRIICLTGLPKTPLDGQAERLARDFHFARLKLSTVVREEV